MAQKHANNGWNCVTNEIVYAWAVMYFSLPNKLLKIEYQNLAPLYNIQTFL